MVLTPNQVQSLMKKSSLSKCLPITINLGTFLKKIEWQKGQPVVGIPDQPATNTLPVLYQQVGPNSWLRVQEQSASKSLVNACLPDYATYQLYAPITNLPYSFGEVYVFPNPVGPNQAPVLHIEIGMSDKISVRIYDVSGELVYESKINESPQVIRGSSAYEHTIDATLKPGVYLGVVTADKAGKDSVRQNFRFSILK